LITPAAGAFFCLRHKKIKIPKREKYIPLPEGGAVVGLKICGEHILICACGGNTFFCLRRKKKFQKRKIYSPP
jgi:hypothetical protein